ncbi:MAG: cyclic nucleotide-binding protein [Ilumatobacteraceae bacterium]|nr:cyclic nucleotide-binding protein [Ilumatobacteraceae bacterium]
MNHDEKAEMLRKVPLFSGCTAKDLQQVTHLMTEVEVESGTVLVREGAGTPEFFIIIDGTATVTREGKEIGTVGPGDFFGEISIIDGGPRTASVTATSAMTINVATHREFVSLLDEAPEIAVNLLPTLTRRIREARAENHTD